MTTALIITALAALGLWLDSRAGFAPIEDDL